MARSNQINAGPAFGNCHYFPQGVASLSLPVSLPGQIGWHTCHVTEWEALCFPISFPCASAEPIDAVFQQLLPHQPAELDPNLTSPSWKSECSMGRRVALPPIGKNLIASSLIRASNDIQELKAKST